MKSDFFVSISGSIADYAWTQTASPAVSLAGAATASPGFTAPDVSSDTTLTFELTVTDDQSDTSTDTVTITVQVFREFDSKGIGSRAKVRDKTGGGRGVAGEFKDGAPLRIRFKPDGTTRTQAGDKKFIFPE